MLAIANTGMIIEEDDWERMSGRVADAAEEFGLTPEITQEALIGHGLSLVGEKPDWLKIVAHLAAEESSSS